MNTPALRLYAEDHPALARAVRSHLEARVTELTGQLIVASDWPDFQRRVGTIRGLIEAIDICAAAEKKLGE